MSSDTTHLLVKKSLHHKLKVLSAQLQVPMMRLTEEGLNLVLTKYQRSDTKNNERNNLNEN